MEDERSRGKNWDGWNGWDGITCMSEGLIKKNWDWDGAFKRVHEIMIRWNEDGCEAALIALLRHFLHDS